MKRDASPHEVAGLTWDQVKARLSAGVAAILPIGAGAKQHGLHMPMATDQVFAEYFAQTRDKGLLVLAAILEDMVEATG